MSGYFQRSLFLSRALKAHVREPTEGRGGRRRGLKSKGEVSEDGRHNRGYQHYQPAKHDMGRSISTVDLLTTFIGTAQP